MKTMLDFKTVVIICCAFIAAASGDLCVRKPKASDFGDPEDGTTYVECPHGCCKKTGYPCCPQPFPKPTMSPKPQPPVITPSNIFDSYEGTAFIVTVCSSLLIPMVMGVALCLVIKNKKKQQRERQERRASRQERRLQREQERTQEQIFFTAGEFGPQVIGPPGIPITPPAYSEIAESPTTPEAPPPPYTTLNRPSTINTNSDDDADKTKDDNLPSV